MALRNIQVLEYLNVARKRLLADPQDDLSDIVRELEDERVKFEKQCRMRVLQVLFIEALFGNDLKSARQALMKCYTLKPKRQVDSAEAARLLQVVWGYCMQIFKEDISELISMLDTSIEFTEAFVRDGFVER